MQCKNHPLAAAIDRCVGCAEPFCGDCLVEMHGQKYCGLCKIMAVKRQPIILETPTIPCKEADEALMYSIAGLVCFFLGFIFGPVALVKASKAKKMIELNPRLKGEGKVVAARIIAGIVLTFWFLGILGNMAKNHSR